MSEEHVGHFFVEASNPLPLERKLSGDLRVRLNGRLEKDLFFPLSVKSVKMNQSCSTQKFDQEHRTYSAKYDPTHNKEPRKLMCVRP